METSNWKSNLRRLLSNHEPVPCLGPAQETHERKTVSRFSSVVRKAFEALKAEIETTGRSVEILVGQYAHAIETFHEGRLEFSYAVKVRLGSAPNVYQRFGDSSFDAQNSVRRYAFADLHKIGERRVIVDFMRAYRKWLKHRAPVVAPVRVPISPSRCGEVVRFPILDQLARHISNFIGIPLARPTYPRRAPSIRL